MRHTCHAHACGKTVPPRMFMCREHWYALPQAFRDAIWREYRPGQEDDKRPSFRYMAVSRLCVGWLAKNGGQTIASGPYLIDSENYRKKAIDAGFGDPLEGLVGYAPQL